MEGRDQEAELSIQAPRTLESQSSSQRSKMPIWPLGQPNWLSTLQGPQAFEASETVPLAVSESQTEQHSPPHIYCLCSTHPPECLAWHLNEALIHLSHLYTFAPAVPTALFIPVQILLTRQGPLQMPVLS